MSNGTSTLYEYDDLYRLIKLTNKKSDGTIISTYDYKVDNRGFRTEVVDNNGKKVNYNYDVVGKLISERTTQGNNVSKTTYVYDKVGNRTSKDKDRQVTKYTYDKNGNLIKKQSASETIDYLYNLEDKLTKVTKKSGENTETEEYKYNPLGTRIQKISNGKEYNYVVDENRDYSKVLEEKDGAKKLIVSYIYGHDLISQNRGNTLSFYYKDGLGSITALGDSTGKVTDSYTYDAFANIYIEKGNTENNY